MKRVAALLVSILPVCLAAQDHSMQMQSHPVVLEQGLGELHYAVSTKNADAQNFFDQGMKYLYGFNHEAAARSFQHASELDPDLAMGYWGVALALGPNINLDVDPDREKQAYDAVQQARAHAAGASNRERDIIETLALRYSNDPAADLHRLAADYAKAMGDLTRKYPEDLDLATLYAESMMDLHPWRLWKPDGTPNEDTAEIVRVLQGVLKKNPNHLGANHYLIHAVEASPHPEIALASAKRFETLAPASGHLVHMPAHIFERTGDYAGAARANTNAAEVDRRFIRKYGGEGVYPLMYYNHNLQFGSASYAMEGDYENSRKMASELASNLTPVLKEMPMVESATASAILVDLRFGRWTDVIKAPVANAGPLSTAMSHYARGVAFAQLGNVAGAESEERAFEVARATLGDDMAMFQSPVKSIGEVAEKVLDGRIAMAKGDVNGAIDFYREAVAAEDKLNYDEPPDWYYPVRETLGSALLQAGKYADAEQVFREDLQKNPHNPRSLYGLSVALEKQNKSASAPLAEFKKRWKGGVLRVAEM